MENDYAGRKYESLLAQMDYATKHFFFIADQRIKTFNFYVIILAASAGGTLQLTATYNTRSFLALAIFHFATPVIFYLIEHRNLALLRLCQRALSRLEHKLGWPVGSRLCTIDGRFNHSRKVRSYRTAIRVSFAGQLLLAMLLLICVGLHMEPGGSSHQSNAKNPPNTATPPAKQSTVVTPSP